MSEEFEYSKVNSENAELLRAMINGTGYTKETESRNAAILKSIINNTEYNEPPQSEIEELLLELKEKGWGGDIDLQTLNVTENGTVNAPSGVAYNKVVTNVPIPENSYFKKSVPNLPAPIASFSDGADIFMPSLKVSIEPVQSGSGDPSPENVRPISGWSEANVSLTGKNLFDITKIYENFISDNQIVCSGGSYYRDFYTNSTGASATVSSDYLIKLPFLKAGSYTLTWNIESGTDGISVYSVDDDGNVTKVHSATSLLSGATITLEKDTKITIRRNANSTVTFSNFMIRNSSASDTYEPYNGKTYTINLGETRYGGRLEIVNGSVKFIGTHKYKKYVGANEENWKKSSTYQGSYYLPSADVSDRKIDTPFLCNLARYVNSNEYAKGTCTGTQGNKAINVWILGADSTLADWNTYIASNNLELCYELETPIEVDLADVAISSLDGDNNLWADTGDVIEAEYLSKSLS